jgi:uncharacterized protein
MHIDGLVALAGLIVGFAVGLTGMGGGSLMTPVLVLVFGVQPLAAVSSDLVASLIMKPVGATVHVARRTVRWPLVAWLSLGSVPSAFIGVVALRLLVRGSRIQNVVQLALGSVLLIAVAAVALKYFIDRRRAGPRESALGADAIPIRRASTVAIGAIVGLAVGITSTGSGTLIIVMLLFLYPRLRGSQMVGTDLAQAVPMVGSAAVAHIVFGDFKLALTLSIVSGSIPGVLLGSLLSARAATSFIRAALCVVLLASGLKLVGVPTLALGIALLSVLVLLTGVWLTNTSLRSTGRADPSYDAATPRQH